MQTKVGSIIESLSNTFIGIFVAWVASLWIFPYYGFEPTASENFQIVVMFTIISIIRNYICRRVFNRFNIFNTSNKTTTNRKNRYKRNEE